MGLGGGDLLSGSAIALNRETRHGGILSFWSRGAQSHFSGREGALSLGGDVRTTMFGADYAKGPLVAGLSLSHSRGLGEYAGVTGGQVASAVTGLYPWLGYKATDLPCGPTSTTIKWVPAGAGLTPSRNLDRLPRPRPRPRRSMRPTAWNPTTLATSTPVRTFCATSTRSSIEMAPTRWPMSFTTGRRLT